MRSHRGFIIQIEQANSTMLTQRVVVELWFNLTACSIANGSMIGQAEDRVIIRFAFCNYGQMGHVFDSFLNNLIHGNKAASSIFHRWSSAASSGGRHPKRLNPTINPAACTGCTLRMCARTYPPVLVLIIPPPDDPADDFCHRCLQPGLQGFSRGLIRSARYTYS